MGESECRPRLSNGRKKGRRSLLFKRSASVPGSQNLRGDLSCSLNNREFLVPDYPNLCLFLPQAEQLRLIVFLSEYVDIDQF